MSSKRKSKTKSLFQDEATVPEDATTTRSPLLLGSSSSSSSSIASDIEPGQMITTTPPSPPSPSQYRPVRPPLIIKGQSFSWRGIFVGLAVGLVITFSNMYFGLQTGWVSTMTMPSSLLGFGIFRVLKSHLRIPFEPVENVLVQTVAGSMAIMPLGCGFVGVLPAMQFLLDEKEGGPVVLGTGRLVLWGLGLCYFGVVFAVPLRRQVILRERLKFPSGFSTAVLISVLHGRGVKGGNEGGGEEEGGFASLVPEEEGDEDEVGEEDGSWTGNVQLLGLCFLISGVATFATYFFPILRNLPVFGTAAAEMWLWTLNPSLAYVGQGIIMGPATTIHMLLGAAVGWGVLSPLAKGRGWAPGRVDDWERGSKGWIVWVSLAIMLADSVVSLGYLAARSAAPLVGGLLKRVGGGRRMGYAALGGAEDNNAAAAWSSEDDEDDEKHDLDAPKDQQISDRVVGVGLVLSIGFCIACIHIVFGDLVPLYATVAAVAMALVLSIMGVRALGETDLNPVSGISKLAQLFFAFIVPQSNKSSVLINLVAGAVSEAGALQAGDLMQDLKTGHLLGAAPRAQFWGQVIGATVGAVVSAFIYKLYTAVYTIPGDLFQVPTGYVWIFTARLVTGEGLPPMAREWAVGSAAVFAVTTALRIYAGDRRWKALVPGGIAVAVGMYNVPSFTLARTVGGLLAWWWRGYKRWEDTPLIILASGFILGEGFLSIVNLIMQSCGVPHL
ncbi:OPT oligopeptide transporter protein-domain-containing protein [Echria macrotheca]|uniref:OPT oligopeptide transporter protein-domain-containing protein n=1 Tax=Echria macrotheca TaxID=438768 RepID=A0AAJ0BMQ4_9PEZI|nr:OPT oligopeptide transporter protein-domain-containing protein [Echria macrotheca]